MDPSAAPAPQEVSAALARWLEARFGGDVCDAAPPSRVSGGFDFWIYAVDLTGPGLPPEWRRPLIVRIAPAAERFPMLESETRLQEWVGSRDYPVPEARALLGPGEILPLPVQVVERVPGITMAAAMTGRPWRIPRLLASLGRLHARLHALAPPETLDGQPAPPLIDRRLALVRIVVERLPASPLAGGLERIESLLPALEVPDPVVCHGDFHPLNILVDGSEARVIDWTDAGVGDRHADAARTAWLFGFAAVAAASRSERAVMGALAPSLARRYLAAYRRHAPLDERRLRLWEPVHVLHAWAMVVADEAELFAPTRAGVDLRPGLAPWAGHEFAQAMDRR